ncbi:hypothetical protein Hanom_Chr00s000003g01603011 [Helianthus anomalus]
MFLFDMYNYKLDLKLIKILNSQIKFCNFSNLKFLDFYISFRGCPSDQAGTSNIIPVLELVS